ncbi:hypothetical protein [Streptomyces jumonjinensis]|uniref:hypothetical protein n=1 Tax=Streptomyces jumonjinensis TaxID=1945 RepID=UPI0037A1B21B
MDVLKVEGPGTVSALAGRTGQAVGNVSHHIRVLARALRASSPTVCRSPDPMTSPIPKSAWSSGYDSTRSATTAGPADTGSDIAGPGPGSPSRTVVRKSAGRPRSPRGIHSWSPATLKAPTACRSPDCFSANARYSARAAGASAREWTAVRW